MKLREYSFLADENIPAIVVAHLKRAGSDIVDAGERNLLGASDLEVLRRAFSEGRVILTHDSDFGTLAVARGEPVVGMVYIRPGHIEPRFTIETLTALFDQLEEIQVPFIVVGERRDDRVRIRLRQL